MKNLLLIIIFLFSVELCFTQINTTISKIDNSSIKAKLDIGELEKIKFIFTDFNGKNFTIIKKSLKQNNSDIEYIGEVEGLATNFIFVRKDMKCYGKLQTLDNIYEFKSIDGKYFDISTKNIFLPKKNCGMDLENYISNNNEEYKLPISNISNNLKIGIGTSAPSECNLRLLIALTDQVSSDPFSDISMIVSVIELNQVLINSGINHKVDLVGIIHNVPDNGFENESSSSVAIEHLMNENDGIADFLVDEKKKYSADILALVQSNSFSNSMGIAGGIGTDSEHSYCIGVRDAVVFYYTLTHEIGHLLGGSHHNASSASLTYGNARGFYKKITSNYTEDYYIGTIMTTGLLDQTNFSTTRQPYFSNLVNSVYPYGLLGATDRNNSVTLDFTLTNHVKGLRDIPQNIIAENNIGYSSFFAENSITTGTIYNSNSGFLVAENSITLKPGTNLSQNFLVKISEVSSCGSGEVPGAIYFSKTNEFLIKDEIIVYPNPALNYLTFYSDNFKVYKATIYDINSKIVFSNSNLSNNIIPTKNLETGVYFIKLENKNNSQTIRFVKK